MKTGKPFEAVLQRATRQVKTKTTFENKVCSAPSDTRYTLGMPATVFRPLQAGKQEIVLYRGKLKYLKALLSSLIFFFLNSLIISLLVVNFDLIPEF